MLNLPREKLTTLFHDEIGDDLQQRFDKPDLEIIADLLVEIFERLLELEHHTHRVE
jgi:hypothetical protein